MWIHRKSKHCTVTPLPVCIFIPYLTTMCLTHSNHPHCLTALYLLLTESSLLHCWARSIYTYTSHLCYVFYYTVFISNYLSDLFYLPAQYILTPLSHLYSLAALYICSIEPFFVTPCPVFINSFMSTPLSRCPVNIYDSTHLRYYFHSFELSPLPCHIVFFPYSYHVLYPTALYIITNLSQRHYLTSLHLFSLT